MKKSIALLVLLVGAINFCHAQKFGFAYKPVREKKIMYISPVKNLEELDCSTTKKYNSYNNKQELVSFYGQCIIAWFNKYLNSLNIFYNDYNTWGETKTQNQYANCTYGNEATCFMSRQEAEDYRQKKIQSYQDDNFQIIQIK